MRPDEPARFFPRAGCQGFLRRSRRRAGRSGRRHARSRSPFRVRHGSNDTSGRRETTSPNGQAVGTRRREGPKTGDARPDDDAAERYVPIPGVREPSWRRSAGTRDRGAFPAQVTARASSSRGPRARALETPAFPCRRVERHRGRRPTQAWPRRRRLKQSVRQRTLRSREVQDQQICSSHDDRHETGRLSTRHP